jgi:hypothetical protein
MKQAEHGALQKNMKGGGGNDRNGCGNESANNYGNSGTSQANGSGNPMSGSSGGAYAEAGSGSSEHEKKQEYWQAKTASLDDSQDQSILSNEILSNEILSNQLDGYAEEETENKCSLDVYTFQPFKSKDPLTESVDISRARHTFVSAKAFEKTGSFFSGWFGSVAATSAALAASSTAASTPPSILPTTPSTPAEALFRRNPKLFFRRNPQLQETIVNRAFSRNFDTLMDFAIKRAFAFWSVYDEIPEYDGYPKEKCRSLLPKVSYYEFYLRFWSQSYQNT